MSFNFTTEATCNVHPSPASGVHGLGLDLVGPESYAFASALKEPSLAAACDVLAPRIVTLKTISGNVHNSFKVEIDLTTTSEIIVEAARASGLYTTPAASVWEVCPQAGLERPLRPAQKIFDIMDAWQTADCRLVLKPGICSSGPQIWASETTFQTKNGKWKKMAVTLDADKPKVYIHKSEDGRPLETIHLNAYTVYLGRESDSTCPCPPSKYRVVFKHEKPSHLLENPAEFHRTFCFDTIEKRDAFFVKMFRRKISLAYSLPPPRTKVCATYRTISPACDSFPLRLPQTPLLGRPTATSSPFSRNGLIARHSESTKLSQTKAQPLGQLKGDGFTGRGLLATHPSFAQA